jgi:hypothetical protein
MLSLSIGAPGLLIYKFWAELKRHMSYFGHP